MTEANGDGNMVSVFHGASERFIEPRIKPRKTELNGSSWPWSRPAPVRVTASQNRSTAQQQCQRTPQRTQPWPRLSLVETRPSLNDDDDAERTNETRPGETILLDENEDLILYLPEDFHHAREVTQTARKNARTPEDADIVFEPPRFLGSEFGCRPVFEQRDFFYWKVIDRFGEVVWRWGPPPHTSLWLR